MISQTKWRRIYPVWGSNKRRQRSKSHLARSVWSQDDSLCCLFNDAVSIYTIQLQVIGYAISVTGRGDPEGCEPSRLSHFLDNRITDGAEVTLRAGRPLTPGRILVLISVRGWVDPRAIVRLERLGELENPITSSEIEPATFRLVA
jgi:hypothetical protein